MNKKENPPNSTMETDKTIVVFEGISNSEFSEILVSSLKQFESMFQSYINSINARSELSDEDLSPIVEDLMALDLKFRGYLAMAAFEVEKTEILFNRKFTD